MNSITKSASLLVVISSALFLSCEERIWTNPHDARTDKNSWAPSELNIEQTEVRKVRLVWKDNAKGEDGYHIDKKVGSDDWSIAAGEVPGDVVGWVDTLIGIGLENSYRLYGFAGDNISAEIAGKITPIIPAPSNLKATQDPIDQTILTWKDNSVGEDGFKIDKKIDDGDWIIGYGAVAEDVETWSDSINVIQITENEMTFYYAVYAYSKSDSSTKENIDISPKPPGAPENINIVSVSYNLEQMLVTWLPAMSTNDSITYHLYYSDMEDGTKELLDEMTDRNVTTYSITNFDPTHENWFWMKVTDFWGREYWGEGMTNEIDSPPIASEINTITTEEISFYVSWSKNEEEDFNSYVLYKSNSSDMSNKTEILTSYYNTSTSHLEADDSQGGDRYFQLVVEDVWGLQTESNIETVESTIRFGKNYGGSEREWGYSVEQTSDNGYIISGYTESYGNGERDAWLIKTDANGNEEWNQPFGGIADDYAFSVQQTMTGGYIFAGSTYSYDDTSNSDLWLINTSSNGSMEWSKTFGGVGYDRGYSVDQTMDGGYVVTGRTWTGSSTDFWLIKTDVNGNEEWSQTYNNGNADYGHFVQETSDGGFIIVGYKYIYSEEHYDIWLIKTDSKGDEVWNKTFGGDASDFARCVQQTKDGGYIIVGNTDSYGNGESDIWLIKTDSQGNEVWNNTFGGADYERSYSVRQTNDGGYIVMGYTSSYGQGNQDMWLIKTDANGNEEWSKTFGGGGSEYAYSGQQTSDGGYIIVGFTYSYHNGFGDVWLVKTDSKGNTILPNTSSSSYDIVFPIEERKHPMEIRDER